MLTTENHPSHAEKYPSELDSHTASYYMRRAASPYRSDYIVRGYDVGAARYKSAHPDYPMIDISSEVTEQKFILPDAAPVYVFTPKDTEPGAGCLFYLHGGDFIAGNIDRSRNTVKYFADYAKAPVIFIDYQTAPEYSCRQIIRQCLASIYKLLDSPYVSSQNIRVGLIGESAGGNLSLACRKLDSARRDAIQFIGLVYPVTDISRRAEAAWDIGYYGEGLSILTKELILSLKNCEEKFRALYLQNDYEDCNPLVSPVYSDNLNFLPRTYIGIAEYDYLRIQNEQFVQKLAESSVTFRTGFFPGVTHGFLDRIGLFPQAKTVIQEIADFWKSECTE